MHDENVEHGTDEIARSPNETADGTSGEEGAERADVELRTIFHRTAEEGRVRLERGTGDLISTGILGGMDVSLGVLALLLVYQATGSSTLAALAFTIGFIALFLGRSELFTENFLIPIAAIAGGAGTIRQLLRLWTVTLVMNMVGALILAGLVAIGYPELGETADDVAGLYSDAEPLPAVARGLLAGITITLMTWLVHAARSDFGRIVAVTVAAFLLSAGKMHHVVVISGEMFIAMLTGEASFGLRDWARVAAIATITNAVGGLVLVTVLRFVQVGPGVIRHERLRRD